MLLKLSWYKFNLECYNFKMLNEISMVTTKKIAIGHTQKERRKKFLPNSNCFKCKWIKLSNQKKEICRVDKNAWSNCMLSTKDSLAIQSFVGLQGYPFKLFSQAVKNNKWQAGFDLQAVICQPLVYMTKACKDVPFKVKKLLLCPVPLSAIAIHEFLCILEASCITLRYKYIFTFSLKCWFWLDP